MRVLMLWETPCLKFRKQATYGPWVILTSHIYMWKTEHVYGSFLDTLHDFSLEQVVKKPTREDNILDLFLLNQPSLVHSTKILLPLGQGDHDIVHHEPKINLGKRKQKQRPIKLFKKTDWDWFRSEMKAYHQTYLENHSSCDTNTKWTEFKMHWVI